MSEPWVLASQSPRRRALLSAIGLVPPVVVPAVDETPEPGEAPIAYALRVAAAKARAVQSNALAADTVVALDGAILAKAGSAEEAVQMLLRLSGRTHAVHTAVVVQVGSGHLERVLADVVTTKVRFRAFGAAEAQRYVDTGEPMDKAGAYGIQGEGGALVAALEGSYTNVVGLPLEETLTLLKLGGLVP